MILHNTSSRLIVGPKSLGASAMWPPGKIEIEDELWKQAEAEIAQVKTRPGKPPFKHPLKPLFEDGTLKADKSGKALPPPPTEAQLAAMTDDQVEALAKRGDLPVTHAEPIVSELGRRESKNRRVRGN